MVEKHAREEGRRPHRIVVVGGGAGGLELATRLGDTLGRKGQAEITLIDYSRTHLWKPLLHRVAAGSMDLNDHELDYLAQARWHHFRFHLGRMQGLDRTRREVRLAAALDDSGVQIMPDTHTRVGTQTLGPVRRCYADGTEQQLMAVWNSWDLLEVAVRNGNAAQVLDAGRGTEVLLAAALRKQTQNKK